MQLSVLRFHLTPTNNWFAEEKCFRHKFQGCLRSLPTQTEYTAFQAVKYMPFNLELKKVTTAHFNYYNVLDML